MLGSLYARGRPATSRVLLAARADPTARSIFGCNALHYASENADSDAEHMRAILAAWPRDPAARGGVAMVADVPVAPEGTMRFTSGVARLRVSCCGNRNKLVRYLASIDGMTALHIRAATWPCAARCSTPAPTPRGATRWACRRWSTRDGG